MENIGLIMEYEDILLGKKADFSTSYINKENTKKDIIEILKYTFEDLLNWSPTVARDYTSKELIQQLHLQRIVNKVEYPPELDENKDYFYLAWLVYPETIHHSQRDLTLNIYQKVLNKELIKFPKNFFLTATGELNASICLQYAINQEICVSSIKDLYMLFADKNKVKTFLNKMRLMVPCQDIYVYPIDMLHNSLPESQKSELYYAYGRFLADMKTTKEANK